MRALTVLLLAAPIGCGPSEEQQRQQEAVERYNQRVSGLSEKILLNPADAAAYVSRGRAHAQNGYPRKAIEDFSEAIRLDPDNIEAYNNRGNAYLDEGNAPMASQDLFVARCLSRAQKQDLASSKHEEDATFAALKEWLGGEFEVDQSGVIVTANLSGTEATDASLQQMNSLRDLETLRLGNTLITDDGLLHLKQLTNLKVLDISQTRITDAGLEHLTGLPDLRRLDLSGTQVTDAGVGELKKALPRCEILR